MSQTSKGKTVPCYSFSRISSLCSALADKYSDFVIAFNEVDLSSGVKYKFKMHVSAQVSVLKSPV